MARGRPAKVSCEDFLKIVLPFIHEIFVENNVDQVVSKTNEVWEKLSLLFNSALSSESIYTMVTANTHKIKDLARKEIGVAQNQSIEADQSQMSLSADCSRDDSVYEKNYIEINCTIPAEVFDAMTHVVAYNRTREGNNRKRNYRRFISGKYQPYFNNVLWENEMIKCGFNYKNNHLDLRGCSGKLSGEFSIKLVIIS